MIPELVNQEIKKWCDKHLTDIHTSISKIGDYQNGESAMWLTNRTNGITLITILTQDTTILVVDILSGITAATSIDLNDPRCFEKTNEVIHDIIESHRK